MMPPVGVTHLKYKDKLSYEQKSWKKHIFGVILTLIIAGLAYGLVQLPGLQMLGQLMLAILLGFAWKLVFTVPKYAEAGIQFSSKTLLRWGIVLLGFRLNLLDIIHAGPYTLLIASSVVCFGIVVIYGLCRAMKIDPVLSILTACGCSICGAAAVVGISPQIKAEAEQTAMAAAVVSFLGTLVTLAYTGLYPVLGLSPLSFGMLSGATLHELAHVMAAAAPKGADVLNLALIVKLTRVLFLIPVAIVLSVWSSFAVRRQDQNQDQEHFREASSIVRVRRLQAIRKLPLPWFIFGCLLMSGINSLAILPNQITTFLVGLAYILMAMSMAGLGLALRIDIFRKYGIRVMLAAMAGSLILSLFGYIIVSFHV